MAGSRAGAKRVAERHSVLKHVTAHCKVTSMDVAAKKENKDKKVVVACSTVAQGVEEWCQMFRCVIVCSSWLKCVETRCSIQCVGMGQTVLLCAAVRCNALKWVASKSR